MRWTTKMYRSTTRARLARESCRSQPCSGIGFGRGAGVVGVVVKGTAGVVGASCCALGSDLFFLPIFCSQHGSCGPVLLYVPKMNISESRSGIYMHISWMAEARCKAEMLDEEMTVADGSGSAQSEAAGRTRRASGHPLIHLFPLPPSSTSCLCIHLCARQDGTTQSTGYPACCGSASTGRGHREEASADYPVHRHVPAHPNRYVTPVLQVLC